MNQSNRKGVTMNARESVLGMLYIVDVRLIHSTTKDKHKHKILMVGCEQADIERKLRWIFDASVYSEFSVKNIEKVREKVHFLSTVITQDSGMTGPVIERAEGSQVVIQQQTSSEPYDPKLFAVGLSTTMLAKDRDHALRKVGNALVASATVGKSHSAASLSADSTITVEEIPRSNGYAQARDVSQEVNRAHMVRG